MARGKETCRILKEIRRQIAEANDIEFITSQCQYKGDCRGTCPKCEAEVRYLEQKLEERRRVGKTVKIAGIAAGALIAAGIGGVAFLSSGSDDAAPSPYEERLLGDVPRPQPEDEPWMRTAGIIMPPSREDEDSLEYSGPNTTLEGDIITEEQGEIPEGEEME